MYEATLIAILHGTNKLDEAQKAIDGKSYSWVVKEEFMDKLHRFSKNNTADVTGELGLDKIFNRGVFTNKITELRPETSIRLSVQGLASYLCKSPGRILPIYGEYFVRGIGGNIHHVNYNRLI